jgi:transposase
MYIGMDLHKNYIQVAAVDKDGQLLYNSKIDNNHDQISDFFKDIRADNTRVVMESSSVWYDTYRYLSEKFDVVLSNPTKTKAIASAKIKTDKIDARTLADLLRADLIPACYIPSMEIMQLRQIVRHREFLVRQRTNLKNKIHGILLLNGIRIQGKPFTKQYISALRNLGDPRINDYLGIIERLDVTIDDVTKKIKAHVKDNRAASIIATVPGIGYYSALLIASEIGDINRFADSHHLCSYAGLVPSVHSSGGTTHYGKITKSGSRHLRWILTECVHAHVRYEKSNLSRFYEKIAKKKGKAKATVATASKMLRVIYWMLKEDREYRDIS